MPLKFKFKTKDEIPADHLPLYAEREGGWILDVEGAVDKSKLDEFRHTNVSLLKERDELKKRYEGIDPEEVRQLTEEKRRLEETAQLKAGEVEKVLEAQVKSLKGTVGTIAMTGNYRYEPAAVRPHRVNLVVPAASLQEIEAILRPTLVRSGGLLARTLRLGRAPVPEWLSERRLEGSISVGSLQIGDWICKSARAKIQWNGTNIILANLGGSIEDAAVAGEAAIDLSGTAPMYSAKGAVGQLDYRGGQLDLKGNLISQGAARFEILKENSEN